MNADALNEIRRTLGLSVSEMALALGFENPEAKGADHIREIERGARPVTGPVAMLLRDMAQGVETSEDSQLADLTARALPRWLDCADLDDHEGAREAEIVMHTRWPRFLALFVDDLDDPDELSESGIPLVKLPEDAGLGWMAVLFIDTPTRSFDALIRECADLKISQARRDLR
jgi:transcriptional regulator with XRE-family HTH domain